MTDVLSGDIRSLKGVGDKRAQLFKKLGVVSVGALIRFYPRAYEDWSQIVPIMAAPLEEVCCVRGIVIKPVQERKIRKGMTLYQTEVKDQSGIMQITLFNTQFAAQRLKTGEAYLFYGRISGNLLRREMASPHFLPAQGGGYIRPIYRQTEGLPSRVIEGAVKQALEFVAGMADPLPEEMRQTWSLCDLQFALQNIHFPQNKAAMEIARRRLVFEELLILQLGMMVMKSRQKRKTDVRMLQDYSAEFYQLLPFEPTKAQRRTIAEAVADLMGEYPMSRLIQGDVGSGKTAVAAAVCYTAIKNGFQCAMMAPTEILAEQHYRSLHQLLQPAGIRVGLLTGSLTAKGKRDIYEQMETGRLDFVVGTHALVQDSVRFQNLGLVVTDEQHRFGVAQRARLAEKGDNPHMLVMSATPIPRTLALIIYGDLDISILDELPPGRQIIETYAVKTALRPRVYRYIQKHLDEGRQAYIVCPLIEEGEADLTAAQEYAQELTQKAFVGYTIGLLHGRMKPVQKENVMRSFARGEIQLLVSTTVVEVGVDVPNAVIMAIENAERFGLSQLHQLRGRVGRGKYKSTCILLSDAQNEEAKRRLKIMCETTDGFRIADEDLKLRGPGEFFGHRQHGLPELKIADMMTDTVVLHQSQAAARELLEKDPSLTGAAHQELKKMIKALFDQVGEKGFN